MTTHIFDTYDEEAFDRGMQPGDVAIVLNEASVYVKAAEGTYDERDYSDHKDCVHIGSLTDVGADDDDEECGYRGSLYKIGDVYYVFLYEEHRCIGRFDEDDDAVTTLSDDSPHGLTLLD